MLPCGTGICFLYIFITLKKNVLLLFIPFLCTFRKSGIDKSTEWSMMPVCPSLMCFFLNRGNTEETNFSKILYLMFVYILCKFVSALISWFYLSAQ